ncbi:hypothetical protein F1880_004227 [Penicillium rolfsii]|nr:hypothetical protein F1880_004227 [Penicillium rolfsii]
MIKTTGQVLLKGSVLYDRDAESIIISQHALALATGNALDLLNSADLEASIGTFLTFNQQGHEDGPLGVSVDTAASAVLKGRQE